jgi:predicted membrane channel-forming protein YqfA (hemolysin III family)
MAMSYKARRRWSLVILLVALPLYIVVALNVIMLFERPSLLLELFIYVALGIVWVLPLKAVFKGVGQADPDAKD